MGPDFDDEEYLNPQHDYVMGWDVLILLIGGFVTAMLLTEPILDWLWGFLQYVVPHHQN